VLAVRKFHVLSLVTVLFGLSLLACLSDPQTRTMRVNGTVTDLQSGQAIPGAKVKVVAGFIGTGFDLMSNSKVTAFHKTGSASEATSAGGAFDVTVSTSERFEMADVTVTAEGYEAYNVKVPFATKQALTFRLEAQ
jgi:hypothetical protein